MAPPGHRPGSPVSTDSNMSTAVMQKRPPKKQKQHAAARLPQQRQPFQEGRLGLLSASPQHPLFPSP